MAKIDIDKFIVALYKELESIEESVVTVAIDNAIESLGYMIVGDKIVSMKPDVPETDFGSKSDDLSDFKKCLVEFYNNARDLITDKDGIKNRNDANSMLNDYQYRLMAIARKELESEGRIGITRAEFESELEHLYTYADEVQYNRGHVDGWDESRKALVDEIDIDAMVDEFNSQLHEWGGATPYRQGIEDVLKKIKSE